MQKFELPIEQAKNIISSEKAASFQFKLIHLGVILALIGAIGLAFGFFFQQGLNNAGLPYRQIQTMAIVVVFVGWVIFKFFSASLGIDTNKLTYGKLMAILKNQVELPFDEDRMARRKIGIALNQLDDQWALYPTIFAAIPKKRLPMVLAGPSGIYAIQIMLQDPRKKGFSDPANPLLAGSQELEKKLKLPVKPILCFFRHKKHYRNEDPDLKTLTLQELSLYLNSRQTTLDSFELRNAQTELRQLSNLTG